MSLNKIYSMIYIILIVSGCRAQSSQSNQKAFFEGDERRDATQEEMLYTIFISSPADASGSSSACSASLIDDDIVITAEHCDMAIGSKIMSGSQFAKGGTTQSAQFDGEVIEVLGTSTVADGIDIEILRVKWNQGSKPSDQKVFRKIWANSNQYPSQAKQFSTNDGFTTSRDTFTEQRKIYTVGFPYDQANPTFSNGDMLHLVEYGSNATYIRSTLGTTQGNSGGFAATDDNVLVGVVSSEDGSNGGQIDKKQKITDQTVGLNSFGSMLHAYNDPILGPVLKQLFDENGNSRTNPSTDNIEPDNTQPDNSGSTNPPLNTQPSQGKIKFSSNMTGSGNIYVQAKVSNSDVVVKFAIDESVNPDLAMICFNTLQNCESEISSQNYTSTFEAVDFERSINGKSIYTTTVSLSSGSKDFTVLFGTSDHSVLEHGYIKLIRQ